MQNRTIEIKFRLNRKEADMFAKHVKKSGMSREAYLRQLINNLIPTELPPPEYHHMMNQLRDIGQSMNQIVHIAHAFNHIDVKRFDEAYAHYKKVVIAITEAVMLPKRI